MDQQLSALDERGQRQQQCRHVFIEAQLRYRIGGGDLVDLPGTYRIRHTATARRADVPDRMM